MIRKSGVSGNGQDSHHKLNSLYSIRSTRACAYTYLDRVIFQSWLRATLFLRRESAPRNTIRVGRARFPCRQQHRNETVIQQQSDLLQSPSVCLAVSVSFRKLNCTNASYIYRMSPATRGHRAVTAHALFQLQIFLV